MLQKTEKKEFKLYPFWEPLRKFYILQPPIEIILKSFNLYGSIYCALTTKVVFCPKPTHRILHHWPLPALTGWPHFSDLQSFCRLLSVFEGSIRMFYLTPRQTRPVMAHLSPICRPSTARQTRSRPWESAQTAWNRSRRRTEGNRRAWEDEDGQLHNSQSAGSAIRRADVRHFNPHLKGLSVA